MRLQRFLSKATGEPNKLIALAVESGEARVNGITVTNTTTQVNRFDAVVFRDTCLQENTAKYFMLNKPVDYLSATKDKAKPTAMDLLNASDAVDLHIAGRLDIGSTGLLLLTNNGSWSKRVMLADNKAPKYYRVTTKLPLDTNLIQAFSTGIYFAHEDITTLPAQLTILDKHTADIVLYEGRYRQIRRMFGAVGNQVVTLHRYAVGEIVLPDNLAAGQYRPLTATEIKAFQPIL